MKTISIDRLSEIASLAIDGLMQDGEEEAMEYFRDTMELTDEEREYFGIPKETENDDS